MVTPNIEPKVSAQQIDKKYTEKNIQENDLKQTGHVESGHI